MNGLNLTETLALTEKLQRAERERDELAAQVRVLREALEQWMQPNAGTDKERIQQAIADREKAEAALALTIPQAARQAVENAEKAARLDRVIEALKCAQELNMMNYNEEDVSLLNAAMIDVWQIATEREADRG